MNSAISTGLFEAWPVTMREEHGSVVQDRLRPGTAMNTRKCRLPVWALKVGLACLSLPTQANPLGCLIEPDRVADVGSASVGVIESIQVERGDFVTAGQVIARLSAGVERASVAVAESRARADAELKAAEAAADLAKAKLARARDLLKSEFISPQALEQAQAESRMADERARQTRDARDVAQREFQLSAAQLGQRIIRAPFEGIVVERYRTQGERIEREPVVRIARIHPLRVEAIAPADRFGSIQSGQVGQVKPQLPQFGTLQATVTVVDRVVDAASNSFRVRLTLPNPDHRIPSGLRCSVDIAAPTPR